MRQGFGRKSRVISGGTWRRSLRQAGAQKFQHRDAEVLKVPTLRVARNRAKEHLEFRDRLAGLLLARMVVICHGAIYHSRPVTGRYVGYNAAKSPPNQIPPPCILSAEGAGAIPAHRVPAHSRPGL
jgi:hypothetical protein